MSAAMLIDTWADTMIATGLLVTGVLLVRKSFARHFGPRLTYGLWAIPALRLVLPPLPLMDPAASTASLSPSGAIEGVVLGSALPIDAPGLVAAPAPIWSLAQGIADAMPVLFLIWLIGMATVIVLALTSHHRYRTAVLIDAVELEPIGTIRLVMSDAVDGPVAFGLWRRIVAVPHDFFARYAAEERALAVDHELAHHRHGDLWANTAALVLLASQWFNPIAWRAIRAFRFDQEAACDARVLTMADQHVRGQRTASYAMAIAKAAVGSRLSLAAPMAIHDNLQERLTMLLQQDISPQRGVMGRLLIAGTALMALGATATLVPAGTAAASTAQPAPPAPPAPPLSQEAPQLAAAPEAMLYASIEEEGTSTSGSDATRATRRDVHRIVIRGAGDTDDAVAVALNGDAAAGGDAGRDQARRIEIHTPGGLSRADILATLSEQGVTGNRAEAIADRLEAKRKERVRIAMAPVPPIPPIPAAPPIPSFGMTGRGRTMDFVQCGGATRTMPVIRHEQSDGARRSRAILAACHDAAAGKAARLSALRSAREAFVTGERSRGLSQEIREKVAADLDKAIAEIEAASD